MDVVKPETPAGAEGRKKMGRRPVADKMLFPRVGLRVESQLPYLAKWSAEGTVTAQVQELLERAMAFWPDGPNSVGRTVKPCRHRAPRALNGWAESRGLSRMEALAVIARKYFEGHTDELGGGGG